ncbi:MAG: hypothetical protein IJ560_00200 [Alphaproteobacteria bacterium]|nr:hypothetical protein [Alphaproteobacteria bacterium]
MTPEQKQYYADATQKLLSKIDKMNLDSGTRTRAKKLTRIFRDAFGCEKIKYETLYPEIAEFGDLSLFKYDSEGFCRAASNAFTTIIGNTPRVWQLMYISEIWEHGPHHYLMHMPSETIFDLTYDQFTGAGIYSVPYDLGYAVKMKTNGDEISQRFVRSIEREFGIKLNKEMDY